VSSDHRRSQIDQGSVSKSRERWRPPDQKRKRGSAGDRTADLENTADNQHNSNKRSYNLAVIQAQANRRRRRQRLAALAWRLGARAYFEFVTSSTGTTTSRISTGGLNGTQTPIPSWSRFSAAIGFPRDRRIIEGGR